MAYQIPLFKLNFDEKEALAAADTIRSGWISTGPKCEELEHIFVDMFHVSYAVAISNCTDALAANRTTNATPNVQYRIFLCIDRLIYHFFKFFISLFPLMPLYFSRFSLLRSIPDS